MSDKKVKTVKELKQEYANLCVKAGDLQYRVKSMNDDLELVYKTMRDVNTEGALAMEREKAAQGASNVQS